MSSEAPPYVRPGERTDRWLTLAVREYAAKALVTAALAAVGLLIIFRSLSGLGLRPTELSMSASGMSVKLERRLANGVEYFVAVSPQVGWQDTDIEIKTTDDVEFWASGHVNLSIFRVNESVQLRRQVEGAINCLRAPNGPRPCADPRSQRFVDSLQKDTLLTPEALFTKEDYERIRPGQPWLGPDGDTVMSDRSFRGRTYKKLAPALPYGRLAGLILPKAEDPDWGNVSQAFGIGRSLESKGGERSAKKTGDLWLAVNDVWNGTGKLTGSTYPDNLFMLDNVGFFWVRITVTHK